ncbi:MAG TPA: hypothetical protein VGA17_07605 [Nitrospiraceae bacterium]|jgi:hypothetical protein
MKKKTLRRKKKTSGVGPAQMKVIIKDMRERYGPMLKRLAD